MADIEDRSVQSLQVVAAVPGAVRFSWPAHVEPPFTYRPSADCQIPLSSLPPAAICAPVPTSVPSGRTYLSVGSRTADAGLAVYAINAAAAVTPAGFSAWQCASGVSDVPGENDVLLIQIF